MIEAYRNFFIASTGASAAFIGLLFVAVSFIDTEKVDAATHKRRRITAGNSFTQLVDVFFVSLIGIYLDPKTFATVCIALACFGLLAAVRSFFQLNHLVKSGRFLSLISAAAFVLQLFAAWQIINSPNDSMLFQHLVLALIVLYASSLARAWEITGIRSK